MAYQQSKAGHCKRELVAAAVTRPDGSESQTRQVELVMARNHPTASGSATSPVGSLGLGCLQLAHLVLVGAVTPPGRRLSGHDEALVLGAADAVSKPPGATGQWR